MGGVDWSKVPPPSGSSPSKVDWNSVPPPPSAPQDSTSVAGASGAHMLNALEFGAAPYIHALSATLGHLPAHLAVAVAPQLLGKWGIGPEDQKPILQQFADYKKGTENYLAQSQKEHPLAAGVGSGVGGGLNAVATSLLTGGGSAVEKVAEKAPSFYESIVNAMRPSAAYGTISGAATSKADLTKPGGAQQMLRDELKGFGEGGVIGAGAATVARPIMAASEKLDELGKSLFFRTAVGQSKTSLRQMEGKGLMDQASEYLSKPAPEGLGIGMGDTTGSIAEKVRARQSTVGEAVGSMMHDLDAHLRDRLAHSGEYRFPPGAPQPESFSVLPENVAKRIEEKAAQYNTAHQQGAYQAMLREAQNVRNVKGPQTFEQSWAHRHGAQQEANYSNVGQDAGRSAIMKDVSQAWNEEIDAQAEPLLRQSGQAGDAYRKLREEYSLLSEMHTHIKENLLSQKSRHLPGMLDYAVGGIVGGVTRNPYDAITSVLLSHAARSATRTYGGAIAGRSAQIMSRLAPESPQIPEFLRGAALSPLSEQDQK